jgi:peptidoglycan/xylan/chitin deacetylase (PgdA/CDA1 family)
MARKEIGGIYRSTGPGTRIEIATERMKQLTTYLKQIRNMVTAVAIVGSMVVATTQQAFAATAASMTTSFVSTGKVSLTFDDGLKSALLAADTLKPFGYAGTEYVISSCVGLTTAPNACAADQNDTYMTWDDIKNLYNNYGWEIGSHTETHPQLSTDKLTDAQIVEQLSGSLNAIKTNTGITPTEFADPYGDYDNNTIATIAKYYASHRAFQDLTFPDASEPITNTFPYYAPRSSSPYNDYMLTVAEIQGDVPEATVEAMIDQAKANNQWLILVFHKIVSGTASTVKDDYQYSASDLTKIAQHLQTTGMPVTSIANGRATSTTNLFANPNLDTALATAASAEDPAVASVWSTRYPTSVKQDTANHGSYPSPTNSVSLTATTSDVELLSPKTAVDPTQTYVIKNYVNAKDLTAGRVSFYIDEYDANGMWVSSQQNAAWNIVSDGTATQVRVGNVNFLYKPTSATVAKMRLQVIVGSPTNNATGVVYYDTPQLIPLSALGNTTTTPPAAKPGDANGDGLVNIKDATIVSLNWGKTVIGAAQGDLNGDGTVNIKDATLISLNWSK